MTTAHQESSDTVAAARAATDLARAHVDEGCRRMSAALCLADAETMLPIDPVAALSRAVESLAYSVGVFHEDYQTAADAIWATVPRAVAS